MNDLLRSEAPSICVILEPQSPSHRLSNFFYRNHYEAIHTIECIGRSGGIWVLKRIGFIFSFAISWVTPRSITLEITMGEVSRYFTVVYANPYYPTRVIDWQHIQEVANNITGLWLAISEWNEILEPSEVSGGDFSAAKALAFKEFLTDCGLEDILSTVNEFTWVRQLHDHPTIRNKLDYFIANLGLFSRWPRGFVARRGSDHHPLLLHLDRHSHSTAVRPFRWEACWSLHANYHCVVKEAWSIGETINIRERLTKVQEASQSFNAVTLVLVW